MVVKASKFKLFAFRVFTFAVYLWTFMVLTKLLQEKGIDGLLNIEYAVFLLVSISLVCLLTAKQANRRFQLTISEQYISGPSMIPLKKSFIRHSDIVKPIDQKEHYGGYKMIESMSNHHIMVNPFLYDKRQLALFYKKLEQTEH